MVVSDFWCASKRSRCYGRARFPKPKHRSRDRRYRKFSIRSTPMTKKLEFNRSGAARIAALTLILGPSLPGWAAGEKGLGFSLEKASPGQDVPQVEVSLGMRPYANDLIF